MIKAVFFDIDGTLVSFKTHEVPASTVKALAALRAKGVKVFIATGRQKGSINNLGSLQFDGYVTLNGGFCLAGDEVIYKRSIPQEDIQALIRYQQEKPFPCALVEEDGLFQNYIDENAFSLYGLLNFPLPPVRPLEENNGKEVFQLIAFFQAVSEQEIMSVLRIARQPVGIRCSLMWCRKAAARRSVSTISLPITALPWRRRWLSVMAATISPCCVMPVSA